MLAPAIVAAVLLLDSRVFAILTGLIILMAAWEWSVISGLQSTLQKCGFTFLIGLILVSTYYINSPLLFIAVHSFAFIFWLMAFYMIVSYQKALKEGYQLLLPATFSGIIVLVSPWVSLLVLHRYEPDGVVLVLLLLVLVWIADIAAYFCGRKWGKTKLCVHVSPGKSREGVYGALLASIVAVGVFALYRELQGLDVLIMVIVALLTVSVSIIGDLFESLVKRLGNVKDSGTILPGHGGVLDRIDSLTAALPVFVALLWLWDKTL